MRLGWSQEKAGSSDERSEGMTTTNNNSVVPEMRHARVNGSGWLSQVTRQGRAARSRARVLGFAPQLGPDRGRPGRPASSRDLRPAGAQRERTAGGTGIFAEDVADLAALLEELDVAPAWVVGNSVGAVIALQLAAARQDLLRGIIVHEPPLRGPLSESGADGPLRVVLELLRAGARADAAERFVDDVALGPGAWAGSPRSCGDDDRERADLPRRGAGAGLADRGRGRPGAIRRADPDHFWRSEPADLPTGAAPPGAAVPQAQCVDTPPRVTSLT